MMYNHVFWDWNGTLINDIQISIESINLSLAKRKLPLMDIERYDRIFSFPVIEYYKTLGFDLQKENYDDLAVEFIDNYKRLLEKATLHKNAKATLERFYKLNIPQYILSASEKTILLGGIKKYNLAKYFTDIVALDNIYAQGKVEIGKIWLQNNPLKGKMVLIGDMPHDYEVAKALGMDCLLICGGHSTREKLEQYNVPVFDNIKEVFNYIVQIPQKKPIYKYNKGTNEEMKNYDFTEIKLKKLDKFTAGYKDFYDDLKNTSKTEDW